MLLWLPDALRDEGVPVKLVRGWSTRGQDWSRSPVGVMNHHTAGYDDLSVVKNGRPGLPGPLANLYPARDGTVHVVAAGEANHAGVGNTSVLVRVREGLEVKGDATEAGDMYGNRYFIAVECEGGVSGLDDFTSAQLDSLFKVNAAICRHYGWNANHCIHHREWTSRKVDMAYRGPLRAHIDGLLQGDWLEMATEEEVRRIVREEVEAIYRLGWRGEGRDGEVSLPHWLNSIAELHRKLDETSAPTDTP